MGIFDRLSISEKTVAAIELDMTPDLAFCTFSAKGLREDLSVTGERVCYFFIEIGVMFPCFISWNAVPDMCISRPR